jgi:hypothetical protein
LLPRAIDGRRFDFDNHRAADWLRSRNGFYPQKTAFIEHGTFAGLREEVNLRNRHCANVLEGPKLLWTGKCECRGFYHKNSTLYLAYIPRAWTGLKLCPIGIVADKAITPTRKRAIKGSYAEEEAGLMAG